MSPFFFTFLFQKEQAHALADALAALPLATFQVALAIHGDPTGQGVEALCRFLRQGDVLLVDGRCHDAC
jgi:hypothetical protein